MSKFSKIACILSVIAFRFKETPLPSPFIFLRNNKQTLINFTTLPFHLGKVLFEFSSLWHNSIQASVIIDFSSKSSIPLHCSKSALTFSFFPRYQKCRVNVNLVGQPLLLDGFSEDIMQSKFGRGKTIKSYDPNFRAATAQPKPKLPTIRIETPPLVKREKMKYEARKNGVTYGGIPNITEALGSDLQNPLSELRLHRSKTYDSSFTSSKKSSSTLPLKLSNSFDLSLDDNSKKQRPMSVMSRISTRNSDRQILLPSQPKFIHLTRPPVFDAHGGMTTDHLNQTISAVERKLGQSLREKAIDSLNVASTFKNKAWLHKINLANNLSRNAIQRKPLQLREQYL